MMELRVGQRTICFRLESKTPTSFSIDSYRAREVENLLPLHEERGRSP